MRKKHGAKKSVEKFQEPSELINNIDFDVLQGAEFKDGGEVGNKQTYAKWKGLVNMSKSELKEFYDSKEGKEAGLKASEAKAQGIDSGRESARWIYKMKSTPVAEWTPAMWKWANKQISFISRMKGVKGDLYDSKGNKTRKHTALLIWGHNPEKYNEGGEVGGGVGGDVINPNERTQWNGYKVGDLIDGTELDQNSGDNISGKNGKKYILTQEPLSKYNYTRQDVYDNDEGYEDYQNGRLDEMKAVFNDLPPIPEQGDGLHRIVVAKELGHKTILMWKEYNPDIRYNDGGMTYRQYVDTQFNEDEDRYLPSDYFKNEFEIKKVSKDNLPLIKIKDGLEYRKWHDSWVKVFDNDYLIGFADTKAIQVAEEYQRRGIGLELVTILKEMNPNHRFGSMTPQGFNLMGAYYDKKVANNPDIRFDNGGMTDFKFKNKNNETGNSRAEGETSFSQSEAAPKEVRYNGTDAITSRGRSQSDKDDARRLAKEKVKNDETNFSLQSAIRYNKSVGLPDIKHHKYKKSDAVAQTGIAELYPRLTGVDSKGYTETKQEAYIFKGYKEKFPSIIADYKIKNYKDLVNKAFAQLIREVDMQYEQLPIHISYHDGDMNYENSADMMDDVHNFGNLWVFSGGEDHPKLGSKTMDAQGLTANEKFRAVHDYYGHSVEGYQFGKDGEENAWIEHSKMLSPLAQWALSTETRGQNSYVNYSGVNAAILETIKIGSELKKRGLAEGNDEMAREGQGLLDTVYDVFIFAEQKAVILPVEYTDTSMYGGIGITTMPEKLNFGSNRKNETEKTLSIKQSGSLHDMENINLIEEEEYGKGGVIITTKIGFNQEIADYIESMSPKFAVWIADSILKDFIKRHSESEPATAKKLALEKINNRGASYVRTVYGNEIRRILDWLQHPLTETQNLKTLSLEEALDKSEIFHRELQVMGGDIDYAEPEENEVLISYPKKSDGTKHYWVHIPSNYCTLESSRMGHCGRTGHGNTLLSLRSIKPYGDKHTISDSHVTIAYNESSGIFYQVKGKKNQKPAEKYFPYIFDLITKLAKKDFKEEREAIEQQISDAESRVKEIGEWFSSLGLFHFPSSTELKGFMSGDPAYNPAIRDIRDEIHRLQRYLDTVKNNKEFDETSAAIKKLEDDRRVIIAQMNEMDMERYALGTKIEKLNRELLKISKGNAFMGFGSEYDSSEDYGFDDMTTEQIKELYEINPNIFKGFAGEYMLYKAGISDKKPNTTFILEKDVSGIKNLLNFRGGYNDSFVSEFLSGENYYEGDSRDYDDIVRYYIDDLDKENELEVIKKISEITSLPIEEVSENGIKYYLSGEDENFEQDDFSSIFDTINRALSDAEGSDMYNYYYKEIKNALEELGNVLSLNDEGVKMEIDLLKIPLTYKEISQIMEDKEIDDLEEVFSEAIYSGEIDLPKFNPDDRFQPSADRKEFNSYLRDIGFDEYKNGGELVLKNNTPTKTQNNTIMEDLKFNELPHIDTVSNGDAVLIREEVFGGDMEKPKHIGTRYITCQVMGKGGIAGTLNLKVKKSVGANAYKMNELIERPLRDVIQTGKKLIVEPISDTASKLGMDDLFQGDLVGYKGGNYEVGGVTTCGKFVKCKNDKGLDSEIELEEFMDNSTLIKRKK
jgi:hypothetical protein